MVYLGGVTASIFSIIFMIFLIMTVGYLLGSISVKGISLGTAGVLLAAILYGILASKVPSFMIGEKEIELFSDALKTRFSFVSSLGTAMFVTSVGLIAGPKFFRSLNRSFLKYILMGVVIIGVGAIITFGLTLVDKNLQPEMAVGLMTGALTSTPGLSAAKEVAADGGDLVTTGYGIAYLFGVLGVVFFVQLMPRILRVNIEEEVKRFVAADTVKLGAQKENLRQVEPFGFFPFALAVALGCIIGAIKIPGINFSLGNSGGCLLAGLIIGHFGHAGSIDFTVSKQTLNFVRELGLSLFLIGAGVPGGVNFVANIRASYFFYGVLITLIPMIVGYLISKYVFKVDLFNALGSITGGMTSTPALGALIQTAGTDDVAASYAATYPVALVCVVLAAKIIILL
ncbi:MAG: YidE/YbjL duplication [Clostridia bacterium]|nr:YidE/YbjL duplication [Clostridia bacterium]